MPERRILCVCRDDQLARSRVAALIQAGYQVLTADTTRAFDVLVGQRFDAVVLAEDLPRRERVFLTRLTRQRWSTPVILMHRLDKDCDVEADAHLDSGSGPETLLATVAGILTPETPGEGASGE